MKEMSRVELYERIRRDHRDEGASIHELSRRYEVHRRTVREAIASSTPPPRKTPERQAPALGPSNATIRPGGTPSDYVVMRYGANATAVTPASNCDGVVTTNQCTSAIEERCSGSPR